MSRNQVIGDPYAGFEDEELYYFEEENEKLNYFFFPPIEDDLNYSFHSIARDDDSDDSDTESVVSDVSSIFDYNKTNILKERVDLSDGLFDGSRIEPVPAGNANWRAYFRKCIVENESYIMLNKILLVSFQTECLKHLNSIRDEYILKMKKLEEEHYKPIKRMKEKFNKSIATQTKKERKQMKIGSCKTYNLIQESLSDYFDLQGKLDEIYLKKIKLITSSMVGIENEFLKRIEEGFYV
ncbi:uncharacterized protein ASCRUDRAFT_76243 [Ascoidea rubescens DSM 1968]|uniref:Uncharacterized protein n=1 Tax=Ascoidea rubescens DSM 1968 TaxID=1344418 RepID=A0A1D2VH24_9ASCO|nr:hypothetical protein ASCRUDRAFT_76243 [Ascoidea rubescens DSM 1968]ODV60892.1 hypothetical protein ASCRUDRAFT_76243 [Ascoidea rubescens DSM 1968]